MKDVAAFTHPLAGLSLIEASAGTGKTTTLVHLYLRALLVEGLSVEQVLAVTYTRAATGELSVRIRAALARARECLADASFPGDAESDDFLAGLVRRAGAERELFRQRADAALAAFDEKAVFTIHGFCQRTLADNAFEAGMAFATERGEDEDLLREEVAADFWRRRTGPAASPLYVRWLLATLKSPAQLLVELRRSLMVGAGLEIEPGTSAGEVQDAEAAFLEAAEAAKSAWNRGRRVLDPWIRSSKDLNRRTYNAKTTPRLLDEWEAWLWQPPSPVLPKHFARLTRAMAEESLSDGVGKDAVPDKPFFKRKLGDALQEAAGKLCEVWWQETIGAAATYVRHETRRRRRKARELGYDDMLRNLREALAGEGGARLACGIAARYRLILVDEFQDTDAQQLEIFTRIHAADETQGLILIGDPKQAIYRFRGADVFTYLEARGRCEARDRLFGLRTNYRSTGALLEALNALFGGADNPFVHRGIPYEPVAAGREIAPLAGGRDAAMTVIAPPVELSAKTGTITKEAAYRIAAETCADEIARLLAEGRRGRLHYAQDGAKAKVEGGDIAVLVPANFQGSMMQEALRRRGIMAALVSTASVFESGEAEELEIVLAAVAEPTDGGLLRRALATSLLGATAATLERLARDGDGWDAVVSAFRDYRECWQTRGFAVMFARLIAEQGIIGRTLARADGERAMTNLRHLAELAGEEASRHPGIAPLLAWFARERTDAVKSDARQLRLESDSELVRIATVHRAKGLEYAIVFLPFLWYAKRPDGTSHPAVLAHDGSRQVLDLGSERLEARRAEADEEARAEEARKAYVALTRAERACYVVALPANGIAESAFAHLLALEEPADLDAALERWRQAAPAAVTLRGPVACGRADAEAPGRARGEARPFAHPDRLRQRFHVASYSLLAAGASGGAAEAPDWDETVEAIPAEQAASGIHAFPAGAASGTLLHALIEALDFDADRESIGDAVQKQLAAFGFEPHWRETLVPWLVELFRTPLVEAGCTLADIPRVRRRDEMEFHFLMNRLEAPKLNAAVAAFAPNVPRSELRFDAVAGQMKGYLDLVFEHDGRYWVADYKSNRLGSDLGAYTPAALDRAMAEHRYDLQYLIYTVAVHRYLQTRIADYDYERHFGGVLYLFLRGMAPDAPKPRGVWHTRPARRDIEQLDMLLAAGPEYNCFGA